MCSTRLRIGPRAFALESPPPSCLNNRPYSPEPPSGLDSRRYPEVAIRETWSEPQLPRSHLLEARIRGPSIHGICPGCQLLNQVIA